MAEYSRVERSGLDDADFLRERVKVLQAMNEALAGEVGRLIARLRELSPSDPLLEEES